MYTRDNPSGVYVNSTHPSNFGPNKMTRFIVHGWMDDIKRLDWDDNMVKATLEVEDSNVITVDWSGGNKYPDYFIAVANTQIVGADIEIFINSYITKNILSADKVHIIGHSLGSHIAGYAAERFKRLNSGKVLGRITGLDPAGPWFENTHVNVRLDPSDAQFVDVIHTGGGRFTGIKFRFNATNWSCGFLSKWW